MTIYADEVFAVNTVSNILLLYAYCILYRIKINKLRLVTAAAAGGVYAVFDAVLALPWVLRIIMLLVMVCIAFGMRGRAAHTLRLMFISVCVEAVTLAGIVLVGGSAVISGVITVFAHGTPAAVIYLLAYPVLIGIKHIMRLRQKYRRVSIIHTGREIEFIALYDSGNLLKYKGRPVITVDWKTAQSLFPYAEFDELELNSTAFVMYNTLSGGGLMPVFEDVKCYINGISVNSVMAVTSRSFTGKYKGIIA